jgi:thiosulfate/3-mercaptopyruvate sulfurtransferase
VLFPESIVPVKKWSSAIGEDDRMSGELISATALAEALGTVTVLDVRFRMGGPSGPEEYAGGHVPGAAYVDLDADLADPPGARGRHPLPEAATFQAAMRRVGVEPDRPVVVYDDWEGRAAARCWWLLRFHGHRDVRLLDGGWRAWTAAGGAVETGAPSGSTGSFVARPGHLPVLEREEVLGFTGTGSLVDARDPERYRGEVEPLDPVAGHIPGAVNVPTGTNLRRDGTFRSPEEIRALYAAAGADGSRPVAAYCGSGVTAAHDVLALSLAGVEAALYPGSWSEWVAEPGRPVETG